MRFRLLVAVMLLVLGFGREGRAQSYDLVIRGGSVVDGTGALAMPGDVAIRDGRVVALGKVTGTGRQELDAHGCVVAPGFIDVHTHAENIAEMPGATNFLRMGVTTIVLGNCGMSELDVAGFFSKLEYAGIAPNVATLIGHGTVRGKAMGGSFMRPPTEAEMTEMKRLVDQGMRDGAVGFSTGLIYLPGSFAKTEEIVELAKVAAKYDGIYTSHMRSESRNIYSALDELFRIASEAHIRTEISHIKLATRPMWGQNATVLEKVAQARARGLVITQDEYLYDASSTSLGQLIPDAALEGGRERFVERLKDAAAKAKIVAEMKAMLKKGARTDYSYAVIADCKTEPALAGLNVMQAARKMHGGDSLDDQIESILEIERRGGASAVFHGMEETDLQAFLKNSNTMIASDSGVREFREGVPHPRGYGNNARLLARYVRELHALSLEEAVRRMTSLPAETFKFKDRGVLREGAWADVVVFQPEAVQDHATYEQPHQYATGFRYVLVNGAVAVDHDEETAARAGKVLRRGQP